MPYVQANGIEIYHEVHGDGPPVLNISGTGGDLRVSLPERNPLNRCFTVVHYDQRGLGRTDKPAGPYTMTDYADDAAALLTELGVASAHVVGTSFGGMVAQHVALQHRERVNRLVLNCTSPGGSIPSFPMHTIEQLDVEARLEVMLGLLDNRWDPGEPDPIPGLGRIYDDIVARSRVERTGDDLRGYRLQLDARSGHDVVDRLADITAPTLVCCGEFDDLAPVANSIALVEGIPNASLRVFDGGHLFLLQDRSAYQIIVDYLNGQLVT